MRTTRARGSVWRPQPVQQHDHHRCRQMQCHRCDDVSTWTIDDLQESVNGLACKKHTELVRQHSASRSDITFKNSEHGLQGNHPKNKTPSHLKPYQADLLIAQRPGSPSAQQIRSEPQGRQTDPSPLIITLLSPRTRGVQCIAQKQQKESPKPVRVWYKVGWGCRSATWV